MNRAPTLTIAILIARSSIAEICALALNNDQVNRRRPLTFSITSGHNLLNPTKSIPATGWAATDFGAAAGTSFSATGSTL